MNRCRWYLFISSLSWHFDEHINRSAIMQRGGERNYCTFHHYHHHHSSLLNYITWCLCRHIQMEACSFSSAHSSSCCQAWYSAIVTQSLWHLTHHEFDVFMNIGFAISRSLSLSLSHTHSLSLCVCVCVCLCVLSVSPFLFTLFLSLSVSLSLCLSNSFSKSLSLHFLLSHCLSVYVCVCVCVLSCCCSLLGCLNSSFVLYSSICF